MIFKHLLDGVAAAHHSEIVEGNLAIDDSLLSWRGSDLSYLRIDRSRNESSHAALN